ncbi:MAG: glycosyltransferase family 4 protein [Pseudomonadota bacterium]
MLDDDFPLRICLISYRSNPHCGGQGVYLKNLSRALKDLGHHVEVISGPPDPHLDDDIIVHKLPCLDLYDPENLFRVPTLKELTDPVNVIEWIGVSTMGFPEPYTFGLRARRFLRGQYHRFDVVHDNQSLSYGIATISQYVPTLPTIHHPITRDRDIDIKSVRAPWKKLKQLRWYSFIPMQRRVARRFSHIITVSESARDDISNDFSIPPHRFRVVPNGIDTNLFHPLPGIEREKNRLMVTNSADTPLKGLHYLLQAVAEISKTRDIRLTVIGAPQKRSRIKKLVRQLGIGRLITFTGRIDQEEFLYHYAKCTLAVVPSLYEGFGLPAGEAMASGVPVISTTAGALPEVVGRAGMLIPPADSAALIQAITFLLDHPEKARELSQAGYQRVHQLFTWKRAAEKTVAAYKETIRDYHKFQSARP